MKALHTIGLLLALLLPAGAVLAAEPAETAAVEADQRETDAPANGADTERPPEDIDAALAEEIRAAEAAQAAAPPASAGETFVPSVQISEDLSVSFPIDI